MDDLSKEQETLDAQSVSIIKNENEDQMNSPTLVSIGLPVFNEERFLHETIESILNQDHPNIEIIISDNASDDATQEICLQYAKKSTNIRYIRQKENIGLGANFRTVLDQAKGKYFMWACGHDLWSQRYISECLQTLIEYPDAELAVPTSHWIDAAGDTLTKSSGYSDSRGMDIIARYFTIFWGNMHSAFGLLRTETLRSWKTRKIVGEDLVFLTFLALRGDFVHVPNAHWYRREFRFEKSYDERIKRYKKGPQQITRTLFDNILPFARLVFYLIIEVLNAKTTLLNKMLIMMLLPPSFIARFYSGKNQYNKPENVTTDSNPV